MGFGVQSSGAFWGSIRGFWGGGFRVWGLRRSGLPQNPKTLNPVLGRLRQKGVQSPGDGSGAISCHPPNRTLGSCPLDLAPESV